MCLCLDLLDLIAGRFPRRVARQPLLARLQEVLRPTVVQILVNAFLAAQLGDAVLTAQPRNHDADLFLRRILSPGCPPNVPNPLLRRFRIRLRFRSHRRSWRVTMRLNSLACSITPFCPTGADEEQSTTQRQRKYAWS